MNYKEKYELIHQHRKAIHVKVTKLMILCFIYEFTNRWVVQAMDSRLASYMNWKFGFTALSFSVMSCFTGIFNCLEQLFLYRYLTYSCNIPVPVLALIGVILETIGYWVMAASNHVALTIVGVFIMMFGYVLGAPASTSIISTTNPAEVQGKVLSWNNLCQQISYVVCPLVLSTVYTANPNATYYSCMIVSAICIVTLCFIIAMPNSKLFGKVNVFEMRGENELPTKKDIEMTTNEGGDNKESTVTIPNGESSTSGVVSIDPLPVVAPSSAAQPSSSPEATELSVPVSPNTVPTEITTTAPTENASIPTNSIL